MAKKRNKVIFCLISLIIVAVFFEFGLRLAGVVYKAYRIGNKKIEAKKNDGVVRILCLGDSFTFGEGAAKGYSYPEQLQRMLDSHLAGKFVVYNAGIPGQNSSQVLKNLDYNIEKYNPEVILLMVGCNNNGNFIDSNYVLFLDSSFKTYLYRADAFLSRLRVYKFFKTFINYLRGKMENRVKNRNKAFFTKHKFFKAIPSKTKNVPKELKEEVDRYLFSGRDYLAKTEIKSAITEFKKAIELNPDDERAYCILGFVYLGRCTNADKEAVEVLKKAVEINPFSEEAHINLFFAYYRIGDDKLARDELEIINFLNPDDQMSKRLLIQGVPKSGDFKIFKRMLEYDLKNIVALTAEKKIKLILQSYPVNWPDEILAKSAKIHKLTYIDNRATFEKIQLLDKYGRGEIYFAEDGHCNANGYRLIAENVYKALISWGIK